MVTAVAVLFGLVSAYLHRVRHSDDVRQDHRSQIGGGFMGRPDREGVFRFTLPKSDRSGRLVPDAQLRLDAWQAAMAQKSWEPARYPWITLEEQPPKPPIR